MPIIKSAKKAVRQSRRKYQRNKAHRSQLKSALKNTLEAIKKGEKEGALKLMQYAYSVIDKSQKKNLIHANNASRKKSRIARTFQKAFAKTA